jgi:hypothetical protein
MTSVQHITQEPPDGTILANDDLTEVYTRQDHTAEKNGDGEEHWYPTGDHYDPMGWDSMLRAGEQWQRLYRQEDVDRLLAAQREQIAAAIEALDPVEAALAGQHAWSEAAKVVRAFTERATR